MDKEILTMEEAAELFGVSIKTFIKLLKEEQVPGRKIGREWRFSRQALINWLSNGDSQVYSASESDIKEFFNEVAPKWEEISQNYYDETLKSKLIEMNILKKSMILADLGAGDGFISRFAAPYVKKVIAVDFSAEMLRELRQKAKIGGMKNIETIESDARDVPIAGSSVDIVCATMYLHHIEQPESALQEMYRIIKPGGTVFLADFYEHTNKDLLMTMHDHWPGFNPDQLIASFKTTGFRDARYETFPSPSGPGAPVPQPVEDQIFIITATK